MKRRLLLIVLGLCLAAPWCAADEPPVFAIRGARIVPVSGPPIENGTVLIRDGLIVAVGANVDIPKAAAVIDGKGLTVYPGLIDALSTVGLPETAAAATQVTVGRGTPSPAPTPTPAPAVAAAPARQSQGPEDRPQTTTWVNAADEISPSDRRIETARNGGFTTALVAPSRGIFAGYGAVVDLAGERPNAMVVKTPAALYMSFGGGGYGGGMGGGFPGSLFGTLAYVRQTFLDLKHYQQEWAAYNAQQRGHKRPGYDRALEGLQAVAAGRAPLLIPAQSAVQIRRYLDFGAELGAPFMLYGVQEAYREGVPELLAGRKATVLVNAKWPEPERDTDPEADEALRVLRLRDRAPSAPAALQKAGVRFAFYSDGAAPRDVLRNVKRAVDAGLPAAAALRALTLTPAEIFGVNDTLGSIEPGKAANLVVADGDLFAERTRIKYVFVDGKKFTVPEEEAPAARPQGAGPAGPAAGVGGVWTLNVETPDGAQPATVNLQAQGGSLSGTVTSAAIGTVRIASGSIEGNTVTFRFTFNMQGEQMEASVQATITGSSTKGTISVVNGPTMAFSGTRPQSREQEVD